MRHLLLFLAPVLSMVACAASSPDETGDPGDDEDRGFATSALSSSCRSSRANILDSVDGARRTAITRGFAWLDADVPYNQSGSHAGYRTDCSGFVSMCWQLGTSFTTADFASGGGGASALSAYDDLSPGDALVRRANGQGHVVLFLGWNDDEQSGACVLEEASTASDMQFRVRTTASLRSQGFEPITTAKLGAASSSTGAACASDGACNPGGDGAGKICVSGHCVEGCRTDAQCPGSTSCTEGVCR